MKSIQAPSSPYVWLQFLAARGKYTKFSIVIMLLAALTAGSFLYGVVMRPSIHAAFNELGMPDDDMKNSLLAGPGNYLGSMFAASDLETLVFDIKFTHISKINADRNAALKTDVLNVSGDDYVPASIRHRDRSIPVKLRLKGDNTDHLVGNKWSFLIKTRNGDQLLGMRRFSVMNPGVRAAQQEPLAYAYVRSLGLMAPRYQFVNIVVNGTEVGVMALEEYPAKEFLESQGRRESVILRFNEEHSWADRAARGYWDLAFDNYAIAPIRAAREGAMKESEKLTRDFKVATGLLKGFVREELSASDVFNVEEIGRYLAALEILNARNGFWWANLRFYYNPISARLEPVASDLMSESPWGQPKEGFELHSLTNEVAREMLADAQLREVFVREIHRQAADVENGSVEAFLRQLEQDMLRALRHDRPFQLEFNYENLKRRAAHLAKVTVENLDYFNSLGGEENIHSTLVLAQTVNSADEWQLELTNAVPVPVEVLSMSWVISEDNAAESGNGASLEFPIESINYPIELSPTENYKLPSIVSLPLPYDPELGLAPSVRIIARIKGTEKSYPTFSSSSYRTLSYRPIITDSLEATLERFPFISLLDENTLAVQPGDHKVSETMSIPKGYDLTVAAGTTLKFAEQTSLIVQGALLINGSIDEPVLFDAQTVAGKLSGWRGLLVLGSSSSKASALEHVTIRNTTGVLEDAWELTGGVNFYEGNIKLTSVTFEDNRAEDALNIIRAEFDMEDVHVNNTVSDGFDSDFSNGTIVGGVFENIGTAGGGDAIDVSGSNIVVTGTRIQDVSDKGLSVGEGSDMTASGVTIVRTLTGAASKDASRLAISDSTISDYQVAGLMAYVKKPEYGPSSIQSTNVQFSEEGEKALAQTGSTIRIDDTLLPTQALDVDALYSSHMAKAVRL